MREYANFVRWLLTRRINEEVMFFVGGLSIMAVVMAGAVLENMVLVWTGVISIVAGVVWAVGHMVIDHMRRLYSQYQKERLDLFRRLGRDYHD